MQKMFRPTWLVDGYPLLFLHPLTTASWKQTADFQTTSKRLTSLARSVGLIVGTIFRSLFHFACLWLPNCSFPFVKVLSSLCQIVIFTFLGPHLWCCLQRIGKRRGGEHQAINAQRWQSGRLCKSIHPYNKDGVLCARPIEGKQEEKGWISFNMQQVFFCLDAESNCNIIIAKIPVCIFYCLLQS